jgi:CheY-like chemotaxis protein
MLTREVIKHMKEDQATARLDAVFAKAHALARQRRQCLTKSQVDALNFAYHKWQSH